MRRKQWKMSPEKRAAAEAKQQAKVDAITHKVAIAFVFIGVFYFFIKLLFL